jgi:hypothetical protein
MLVVINHNFLLVAENLTPDLSRKIFLNTDNLLGIANCITSHLENLCLM